MAVYIFKSLTIFGVFLLGAGYFLFEDGYRYGAIILALTGLASIRDWQWQDYGLRILCLGMLFPLLSGAMVVWHEGWGSRASMYISILAALPIFLAVRQFKPDIRWLLWGAAVGAITAGGIALYDTVILSKSRAGGLMNPIKFGNMALFMACVALVVVLFPLKNRSLPSLFFFLLAAFFGLLASLLSESRGGWLALPVLVFFYALWALPVLGWRRIGFGLGITTSLAAVALFSNLLGMTDRIMQAWLEWDNYHSINTTSIGHRINMWLLSVDMIRELPFLGHGDAAFGYRTEQLHALGGISFAGDFNHPHNDLLNSWVRHGIFGVISLLVALIAPMIWFWRSSRIDSRNVCVPLIGFLLCLCLLVFGQTQVFLGSKSMTVTYYAWLAVLLAYGPCHCDLSKRGIEKLSRSS